MVSTINDGEGTIKHICFSGIFHGSIYDNGTNSNCVELCFDPERGVFDYISVVYWYFMVSGTCNLKYIECA